MADPVDTGGADLSRSLRLLESPQVLLSGLSVSNDRTLPLHFVRSLLAQNHGRLVASSAHHLRASVLDVDLGDFESRLGADVLRSTLARP